ncbi:MAG: hypothetical protein DI535_04060 [Citrobacter freundii]|nr:MAG: hypothetical protein DI535_04060 [Citrobacter freundii]
MKPIKLLSLAIALFQFAHGGYCQLGNLPGKIKIKSEKSVTSAGKTSAGDKTEVSPATTTEKTANEENNLNTKAMSTESIPVNSKYFLHEDLKLIPGATFYFSDKPFGNSHDGAKTSFRSSGFIYGRLELKNQTIEEAFKVNPIGKNYYLIYAFAVVNGSEGKYAQTNHNCVMLKAEDIKKSAFNFDILPDPAHATTGIGMNYDYGFDALHVSGGPMYQIIDQSKFPDNGDYIIQLQFYFRPVDGWGNGLPNSSDWPGAEGAFQFSFNSADVASITKNFTAVH